MKTRTRRTRGGFTLIELLIVVVIIGILASIAIPKFSAARERGFRAAMMSDLKNLASYQEAYYNTGFTYSDDLDAIGAQQSEGVTLTVTEAHNTGWAAIATHEGVADEECGIYHGNTDPANGGPATTESVVGCSF